MFNNSSVLPLVPEEKEKWDNPVQCFLWQLRNKTISHDQAKEACSMDMDVTGLETAPAVVLLAILIIFTNAVVVWGIFVTRELHKPLYFYMSNLAMSDILGGVGLIIQTVARAKLATMRGMMTTVTFMTHSQVMSASALALLSVNSYVAVRHPIYHHTHAHTAKRNAALAIVSSWLVLTLFTFSPDMGWNCIDMPMPECFDLFHITYMGILAAIVLLFISIMLFTNISIYIAIKQREKRRLGQPGAVQPTQDNTPGQNVAGHNQANNDGQAEADLKFKKSVQKARTVMIHVVVAIIFWLLPVVIVPICVNDKENCPLPVAIPVLMTLNSLINPIANIFRTPDLRKGIRQNIASIRRGVVTMIRGNRVNPQGEQTAPVNTLSIQVGAASGSEQSKPEQPAPKNRKTVNQGIEGPKIPHFKTQSANLPIVEAD